MSVEPLDCICVWPEFNFSGSTDKDFRKIDTKTQHCLQLDRVHRKLSSRPFFSLCILYCLSKLSISGEFSFFPRCFLTLCFLSVDGDVLAIKEHLIDELDYILVPTEGWNKLVSWYGLTEGQEPIARKVKLKGFHQSLCSDQ